MTDPKKNQSAELMEDQLSGGEMNGDVFIQPMTFKCCCIHRGRDVLRDGPRRSAH